MKVKEMSKIKNWSEKEMNRYLGDREAFDKIFKQYVTHINKVITGKDKPIN